MKMDWGDFVQSLVLLGNIYGKYGIVMVILTVFHGWV